MPRIPDEGRLVLLAYALAKRKHGGRLDKRGRPLFGHVQRVSERCGTPIERAVALLHDIVEDTDIRLDDLRSIGFPEEVVGPVGLLTRRRGQRYQSYIRRLRNDPVARAVKLADLADNLDPERFAAGLAGLRERYLWAREALTAPQAHQAP